MRRPKTQFCDREVLFYESQPQTCNLSLIHIPIIDKHVCYRSKDATLGHRVVFSTGRVVRSTFDHVTDHRFRRHFISLLLPCLSILHSMNITIQKNMSMIESAFKKAQPPSAICTSAVYSDCKQNPLPSLFRFTYNGMAPNR